MDSESKESLIGANIMLDGTSLGAASDDNGYYIIKNIPIGTYTLRAMFIGYETLEKEIWVEGSQEYTININVCLLYLCQEKRNHFAGLYSIPASTPILSFVDRLIGIDLIISIPSVVVSPVSSCIRSNESVSRW